MNFIEEDGFIKAFHEKLLKEKVLNIKLSSSFDYILQTINLIYDTRITYRENKINMKNGSFYFYTIIVDDNNIIENPLVDGANI